MHVSPAAEGHWIGFIVAATVALYRWHHHYLIVVVDNQYNWLYVKHFSSSTRDSGPPDSSFISLEKGDKTASKLSERGLWQTKSEAISLFLLDFLQF